MNNKGLNITFASTMLVIITMIAMAMTAGLAMAHDGKHEGEHGATVTVNTFELDTDDSTEDVLINEIDVETDESTDIPLDETEVKTDEGEEGATTTEEEVVEEVVEDEPEETLVEEVQSSPDAGECEIEGHKYDQDGNPLADWVVGLMKTVTQGDNQDIFDLDKDTTDTDGYYCLNWDGETREYRGEGEQTTTDGEFSFIYSVYEKLVNGWKYLSIEKGADHNNLEVVPESEVNYDGDYISTQIGEENGYIYSDAAYHVDFYNELIEKEDDNDEEEVVEEDRTTGSSGTRVGDRNRSSGTRTDRNKSEETLPTPEPTPIVLGEQVSVIPAGAPGAGAGMGTMLTFEQMLFTSERLQLIK